MPVLMICVEFPSEWTARKSFKRNKQTKHIYQPICGKHKTDKNSTIKIEQRLRCVQNIFHSFESSIAWRSICLSFLLAASQACILLNIVFIALLFDLERSQLFELNFQRILFECVISFSWLGLATDKLDFWEIEKKRETHLKPVDELQLNRCTNGHCWTFTADESGARKLRNTWMGNQLRMEVKFGQMT